MPRFHGLNGLVLVCLLLPVTWAEQDLGPSSEFQEVIEADWTRQAQRLGRVPSSLRTLVTAMDRAGQLLEALSEVPHGPVQDQDRVDQAALESRVQAAESMGRPQRTRLYHDIRWFTRRLALRNPLVAGRQILFMQRKRFVCQMLHEYLGYYYDYEDISGGGIYRLERPGLSFEARDLNRGRLGRGNYATLSLSHDAETIYFAFARRAESKPDYYSAQRECFHIYAMDADGGNLRQVTRGPNDDFDPCPLPDGGMAFMSSARGGFTRCNNPWEPLPAHTLHRLDPTLSERQTLSFHETSEWHPSVLHDGRIVYIRWDYVDRSAANFHGLWITNPDGTGAVSLFGNYTMRINACYQPKAVPGSHKIVFLAGAHHADVGGSLVLLDPHRVALDQDTGQDSLDAIEVLTPEVCFPEAPGWPDSYFHSPWPLSEDYYLVAFSFDPLPGMGPQVKKDTETGLYYFDRFGNLELLYRQEGISSMYPIVLAPRDVPPVVPAALDRSLEDEGEFFVNDVKESHFPMPEDRQIVTLRVFQVLPKSRTHVANEPRIGHANAESARMLLGTVPVEKDGSAYFRAPARKPLYFQAVDASGRAVQSMRSVTYLQPGERRGCVGCHETPHQVGGAETVRPLALQRSPSRIKAGPLGTRPFSFPLLVQPILDEHCVRCHDGDRGANKSPLILTAQPSGHFSKSYENLKPFVRWYEWGGASIEPIVTRPGKIGSDASALVTILSDSLHGEHVRLSEAELRRLYIWMDGNVPFYGLYDSAGQRAQRRGHSVDPPALQ